MNYSSPMSSPKTGPTPSPGNNINKRADNENASTSTVDIPSQTLAFSEPSKRPSLSRFSSGSDDNGRRASVQFLSHVRVSGDTSRSRSRKAVRDTGGRRLSSPPPPTQFKPRVSFDTFDNRDATDFSLTLSRKHRDYEYTKRSRTFLCGTDANDYSDTALEWLMDELVDDGDEIVCLRVVEKESKEATKWSGGGVGREGRERGYKEEAQRMLQRIQDKNLEDKSVNLILEFSIGKVPDTIQHMIRIYEPAILVVGTRGRSLGGFQGLLPGSVSKYCLQHSPVPVIVVRPSSKRDKKKKKRMLDPSRRGYRDILDKSDEALAGEGGHILDQRIPVGTLAELQQRDADEEARMVAEAIGYKKTHTSDGHPLSRVTSARSDVSGRSAPSARSNSFGSYRSDSPEAIRSPKALMKDADMRNVDSPAVSDTDFDSEDEDEAPVPAHLAAQEKALQEARERALKVVEEEKEREREAEDAKTRKHNNNAFGGGAGVLDIFDQLGGNEGAAKKKGPQRTVDSRGRKLAGGYPIP